MKPDLDYWLPDASLCVRHRRESDAPAERLWEAASSVRLTDTSLLGRLVRWRIPGTSVGLSFDELFRSPPFIVLEDGDMALMSGIVGRIWTLRRDYPQLSEPEEFRGWSRRGTARVLFANWVEDADEGRAALTSESRVEPFGTQGRIGVRAVRPIVSAFHHLVESEGFAAAIRLAEGRRQR